MKTTCAVTGISDNFIHNPYFRSPALNRLFSIVDSTFSARCRTDTSGEREENFLGQLRQLSSGYCSRSSRAKPHANLTRFSTGETHHQLDALK